MRVVAHSSAICASGSARALSARAAAASGLTSQLILHSQELRWLAATSCPRVWDRPTHRAHPSLCILFIRPAACPCVTASRYIVMSQQGRTGFLLSGHCSRGSGGVWHRVWQGGQATFAAGARRKQRPFHCISHHVCSQGARRASCGLVVSPQGWTLQRVRAPAPSAAWPMCCEFSNMLLEHAKMM